MNDHEAYRNRADAAYAAVNALLDEGVPAMVPPEMYDAAVHLLGYLARIVRDV